MASFLYRVCWCVGLLFVQLLNAAELPHEKKELPKEKEYVFQVNPFNYQIYQDFLAGRNPLEIKEFEFKRYSRHLFEMYLFQLAPILGGCDCKITFIPYSIYSTEIRSLVNVMSGRSLSSPLGTYLRLNLLSSDKLFFSQPILDGKDFFVGLFVNKQRKDLVNLSENDIQKIRGLRFGIGKTWNVDRDVLKRLGLEVVEVNDWPAIIRMIKIGRIDVVLQPFGMFPDVDIIDQSGAVTLTPIKGVKVMFGHSRHYVVSKQHPDGKAFNKYLNKGLDRMRASGDYMKLAKAAGFFQDEIKNWTLLSGVESN